jgi:hypothetical protein
MATGLEQISSSSQHGDAGYRSHYLPPLKDKDYRARLGHVQHKLRLITKLATIILYYLAVFDL